MPDDTPLLELDGVEKTYDGAGGAEPLRILRGVSLRLAPAESVAVVGPSGSGKSTLLHLCGALDRPSAGAVRFDGRDLAELDEDERADLRNRALGFVFQFHHLLPQCTALENVLVPLLARPPHRARAEDVARARELLARAGLAAREGHRPAQLSGGERQRVAVARALVRRPRLLLADEPSGSLDGATADALGAWLAELNRTEGVALLTVTHSAALAARHGRVLALREGRLTAAEARSA